MIHQQCRNAKTDFITLVVRTLRSFYFSLSKASGDLYLPETQNQFLQLNSLLDLDYLMGLSHNCSLSMSFFFILGGWWLLSLAAVAFDFIWVCNQEAMILPETVRGTIYTIQIEFTFFTLELLGSWKGWLCFVQFSTGCIQQLVRTNLCGLRLLVLPEQHMWRIWKEGNDRIGV